MGDKQLFSRDVTGKIDISDPDAVCAAVLSIFERRYLGHDFASITQLFVDFARLYRGEYPGFFACDTQYHDMQHVLDVTLATARLIDGFDASQAQNDCLGPELAKIGVAVALFHDSGYIRRKGDTRHQFGAEYTKIHVSRSSRFLAEYLPTTALAVAADTAAELVHFTGYEVDPASIPLQDAKLRQLGALIGSADVMAQMADPAYLEKCRDRLFGEFELGGLTREQDADGVERVRYASPTDLLRQTPEFIQRTLDDRLDNLFGRAHNYFCAHFGGRNLYLEAIQRNRFLLERLLAQRDEALLLRTPLHI
ncbi:MAG: hypothetical protein QM709_09360 [Spongiibacteraceae bacterium]